MNRRRKYNDYEKEIWNRGRKAGVFTALNFIVPIPIEQMNKDMLRLTASLLNIPGYSKMRDIELLQSIRNKNVEKAGFKRKQNANGFELIQVPRN